MQLERPSCRPDNTKPSMAKHLQLRDHAKRSPSRVFTEELRRDFQEAAGKAGDYFEWIKTHDARCNSLRVAGQDSVDRRIQPSAQK